MKEERFYLVRSQSPDDGGLRDTGIFLLYDKERSRYVSHGNSPLIFLSERSAESYVKTYHMGRIVKK